MHIESPTATVVIPARNAAKTLGIQLEALVNQIAAPPFEVVVADNGSTDGTADVASAFADALDIRVVDASIRRGPSFARNVGAELARAPKLLFCDADDRVHSGWIAALSRILDRHEVATGPVLYVEAGSLDVEPSVPEVVPRAPRHYFDTVPFAGAGNLGLRAETMKALGGFDLSLQCGEDADLSIRAQLGGALLGWEDDAIVFTARRGSLAAAARQFFRYGYYDASLYRKLRTLGLPDRTAWVKVRPYVVLVLTPYRLFTSRRRWSWIVNASQRAGRLIGSARFGVFCP